MYIDIAALKELAAIITALTTIGTAIVALYKLLERDKRQQSKIEALQAEQTIICYGVLACLKGLAEQGCNGPVHDALDKLEKHLNKAAHDQEGG